MIPKSKTGSTKHRKAKREREISLSFQVISEQLKNIRNVSNEDLQILEFGSGLGFQISALSKLGSVTVSDIYVSEEMRNLVPDVKFVQCSMLDAPFYENQFDLIYSNHVLEHIEDIAAAFKELQRIGNDNCLYAFALPTNIWLILALPALYLNKFRSFIGRLISKSKNNKPIKNTFIGAESKGKGSTLLNFLMPNGHGVHTNYNECYNFFKIENWLKLFEMNGFELIEKRSLLLYAPSEWPIIPTMNVSKKSRFCSSILFLLKKDKNDRK
ncbi:MAG: class I SAM-dependent methyltransferase [Candidatus Marinimicrobia bacterium]|nr:class I SAM-dependent methyltransferase [Candidatus Neomarinimicrobiota bacterium]